METIIEVKNLFKTYKVQRREKEGLKAALASLFHRKYQLISAVDGISIKVKAGTIHALIGVNGSGKSTVIKILSGILHPTAGSVNVMGYCPWKERASYVRKIGVLFGQKTQLGWELPAIDTYLLQKTIYNIPEEVFRNRLDEMVTTFGLEDIIQKPVRNLSLGERMKCELLCILLHEPPLVFLDEPTIGLDLLSKNSVRKFIKKINEEKGTTFILTSHDMSDVENLCTSASIIHKGKMVYDGPLTDLKSKFDNKKVIKIKFTESVLPKDINGFPLQFADPLNARMEIEMTNSAIRNDLFKLIEKLPVLDVEIVTPDMETIVRTFFEEKASSELPKEIIATAIEQIPG